MLSPNNKSNIPLEFPKPFNILYNEGFYDRTLKDTLVATNVIGLTKLQADLNFEQSSYNLWFQFQTGRVTASKLKSVCRTSLFKPSISLIFSICYPNRNKKMFKAVAYSCQHEQAALDKYLDDHKNLYPCAQLPPNRILICSEFGEIYIEV